MKKLISFFVFTLRFKRNKLPHISFDYKRFEKHITSDTKYYGVRLNKITKSKLERILPIEYKIIKEYGEIKVLYITYDKKEYSRIKKQAIETEKYLTSLTYYEKLNLIKKYKIYTQLDKTLEVFLGVLSDDECYKYTDEIAELAEYLEREMLSILTGDKITRLKERLEVEVELVKRKNKLAKEENENVYL